jgi:hypothetical protein
MMKKIVLLLIVLLCGMTAGAQTVGEITDSVKAGLHSSSVKEAIKTVKGAFAKKSAEAAQMIGTWTFLEPAVMITSGNLLAKAAGNLVDDKLERMLNEYFERANVTAENTAFTFRKDGTFVRSLAGRKKQGVWMVGGDKLLLGIDNVQTADMTTHMENDTLTAVVDVSRVMGLLQTVGAMSDSKTNNALIKLAKSLKGVGAGFVLVKEKKDKGKKVKR